MLISSASERFEKIAKEVVGELQFHFLKKEILKITRSAKERKIGLCVKSFHT
jgi:hypothetical protein